MATRRYTLPSPPPSARPAALAARLKPRLHSPTPPPRSPGSPKGLPTCGHCRTPGRAQSAGPRAERRDEAPQRRPREPPAKQPAHEEPGLPGGGRAGRGRGGAKRTVASPGRRAQGTWPGRGKARGKGKPCTETGSWLWPGGPQGGRAGRPTAIPFSERITAPRAVWPEGQRTKTNGTHQTDGWRSGFPWSMARIPPQRWVGVCQCRVAFLRLSKSPSTALPEMPQAAQRLAAAPARPAAPGSAAADCPWGGGLGGGPRAQAGDRAHLDREGSRRTAGTIPWCRYWWTWRRAASRPR